jgi:hypothetical protein
VSCRANKPDIAGVWRIRYEGDMHIVRMLEQRPN